MRSNLWEKMYVTKNISKPRRSLTRIGYLIARHGNNIPSDNVSGRFLRFFAMLVAREIFHFDNVIIRASCYKDKLSF